MSTALIFLVYILVFQTYLYLLQVDAWYYSPYEPWSRFLTGEQGRAPEPLWDPLAFMIKICHERFIELHAWINPYRAVADISSYVAPRHPSKQHPEWFVRYGKQLLFNPRLPEVRAYTCKVQFLMIVCFPSKLSMLLTLFFTEV
ncbi:family 10 glycosylhydrolase [Prevotella histicola]|uniref:family 10 glycosylhydrolase n=1 Tax=Prevotella histicola TaxID=470565 RepID=UPI001E464CAC|nr:family 10 glycosylhydrolase [Prevotella histicola]